MTANAKLLAAAGKAETFIMHMVNMKLGDRIAKRKEVLKLLREAIAEQTDTRSPYVPRREPFPPHGENVLFWTRNGAWLGWRREDDRKWLDHFDDHDICDDSHVIGWMPIPESPCISSSGS